MASGRDLGGLGEIVVSGRDSSGAGGGIVALGRDLGGLGERVGFGRDLGGLGGIVVSERDSGGAGGGIGRDSSRAGGGIEGFGRDLGRAEEIVASRRDSCGLGRIVASGRDSDRLGGGIEGFRRVHAVARLLGGALGCNSCKAFLFDFDLPWQAMQVARTLPLGLEASLRNKESGSFWIQAEQYFEAIPNVKK